MDIAEYGNASASIVLIQPISGHDHDMIEREIEHIRESTAEDFRLIAVRVKDWNNDLSPWEAPAVFGKEGFGGRAEDTLEEVLKHCEDRSNRYYIGGYSLAGLFALWAACQSDIFHGVAAASPSVWYPGFADYINGHEIRSPKVYLSLGDKEEKTRNPVMATVGDRIRDMYELLKKRNVSCTLEWNEGNHFKDADLRTARAFSWVLIQ